MDSFSNDQSYMGTERTQVNRLLGRAGTGSASTSFYETTPNRNQFDGSRLAECLDYLHRMISRKDKDEIFQWPVTDDIAPGYSLIIANPMDLSTMRKKIDTHAYNTLKEYRVRG